MVSVLSAPQRFSISSYFACAMATRSVWFAISAAAFSIFFDSKVSSSALYWFSVCHSSYSLSSTFRAVLFASSFVLYFSSICWATVFFVPEPEDLVVLPPLPVGFSASFGSFFISASRSSAVSPVLPPRPFHSSFVPLTIFGTAFSTPGTFGICTPLTALLMAF